MKEKLFSRVQLKRRLAALARRYRIKLPFCAAAAAAAAYVFGGFFADIVGIVLTESDPLTLLPGGHDTQGQLAVFVLAFAYAWFSLYRLFVGRLEELIGPQLVNKLGFTPSYTLGALQMDELFRSGPKQLLYKGTAKRTLAYDDNGRGRSYRLHQPFKVVRNTGAMTPREREAVTILYGLRNKRLITMNAFDRLEFALIWGEGNGGARGDRFNIPRRVAQQYNLYAIHDLVRLEAQMRGARLEPAIGELFGRLADIAGRPDAPEDIKRLASEIFPDRNEGSHGRLPDDFTNYE